MSAMLDLPRERFLPREQAPFAYYDRDIEVGEHNRRLLSPVVLAKLIQSVDLRSSDRVLDVGCATGYSTALFARLAATVVGLEEDAALARDAAEAIKELGLHNASIVTGSLVRGVAESAPYDVIALEGACEVIGSELFEQLGDGGRLIAILGRSPGRATVYLRNGTHISSRPVFEAAAARLPGFSKPPEFAF